MRANGGFDLVCRDMKPRRRTFKLQLALAFFLVSHLSRGQQFTISTVAGFYSPGNTPTGAQDVIIGAPQGIATDSKGNIYTTETYRGQRVQKFVYKGMGPVTKVDQGVVWPK